MPATPSYRRPLNSKQLDILRLLYRFRFVTSNLLTPTLKLKDPSKTNQRLRILTDQKYIGRRYKSEYRLLGKPASYHLLPDGIKALKQIPDNKFSAAVLHNIRKDFDASDQFIDRQLGVLSTFCHLSAQYGVGLRFFTQSELRKYSYFPKPLPYAYIRLRMGDSEKQFFLEVINDSQPFFKAIGRIKRIRHKIGLRSVWTDRPKGNAHIWQGGDYKVERRYAPRGFTPVMGYSLYKDKVMFVSSHDEYYGFIVHSKDFSKLQSAQFELLWSMSKAEK
jgi:hypothetical protein